MKILLFSNNDQRSRWLETSLDAARYDVVCAPRLASGKSCDLSWNQSNQSQIIARVKPDLILYVGCLSEASFDVSASTSLIIDTANSNKLTEKILDDPSLPNRIVALLSKSDKLLTTSKDDQLYWYGWLLQAGKVPGSCHDVLIVKDCLQELLAYLKQPRTPQVAKPAKGFVYSRPSFLAPIGTAYDLPLSEGSGVLRQEFTVPIDDLYSVVLPIRFRDELAISEIDHLEAEIRTPEGRVVSCEKLKPEQIPNGGSIFLNFSKICPPKGGSVFELRLKLTEKNNASSSSPIYLKAYKEANYPLSELGSSNTNSSGSLALSFHPNSCKVYLISRAFKMLLSGEWKRFYRAIRRRFAVA